MHGESSTTGLLVHLKAIHKITDFDSKIENETAKREKKKLTSFFTQKKSVKEEIVKLLTLILVLLPQKSLTENKHNPPLTM